MHLAARLGHMGRGRRVSGQLECHVGLDGRVQFRRAARVNIPSAVRPLPAADIIRQHGSPAMIQFPQNLQEEEIVGFQRGVGLQLADPVSLRRLQGEQVVYGFLDGLLEGIFEAAFGIRGTPLRPLCNWSGLSSL